ncbi:MAG: cytochrome-c peroxidase, partial [Pararheinheimera sp.]|nr:cytochrome-c peroxidase [Rheinheimera sp.]
MMLSLAAAVALTGGAVSLNNQCPPSFELSQQNKCLLVTRYDHYDSLHNKGVGGTKTALPKARDGFSPEQIDLGRYLFFDPLLSANHKQACASCHQPAHGFSDGKALSTGSNGDIGTRSAPGLWNVGFLKKLFWDGRSDTLEQQALIPLFAPHEMANTAEQVLADLSSSALYPDLFRQAFPLSTELELSQVAAALAAFQSSLI